MLLYILYNVWVDKPVDKYLKKKVKEKKRKIRKKMPESVVLTNNWIELVYYSVQFYKYILLIL